MPNDLAKNSTQLVRDFVSRKPISLENLHLDTSAEYFDRTGFHPTNILFVVRFALKLRAQLAHSASCRRVAGHPAPPDLRPPVAPGVGECKEFRLGVVNQSLRSRRSRPAVSVESRIPSLTPRPTRSVPLQVARGVALATCAVGIQPKNSAAIVAAVFG